MSFQMSQVVDPQYRRGSGDPRLRDVGGRHVEAPHAEAIEVGDDRQRAADRSERAVKCELAQPRGIARQATFLARTDDRRRHREVEATPLFGKLRRCEVDRHSTAGELKAAVVDGDLHPLTGFLERPVAESHDVKPREAVGNVRLHLNPNTIEAEDRPAQGPGQHQGRYYTSLCIGVCSLVVWRRFSSRHPKQPWIKKNRMSTRMTSD